MLSRPADDKLSHTSGSLKAKFHCLADVCKRSSQMRPIDVDRNRGRSGTLSAVTDTATF